MAGRDNRFDADDSRNSAVAVVRAYRERLAELSEMPALDVWYAKIDAMKWIEGTDDPELRALREKRIKKAQARTALGHEYPNLVEETGGRPRIKDDPPHIYSLRGQE